MRLASFNLERPLCEAAQAGILEFLADTHARAATEGSSADDRPVRDRMRRLVRHVCCGEDKIATRGFSALELAEDIGASTAERTDVYAREVERVFEKLYADVTDPPDDLVHVTCTGYVSPSAAQRIVSSRGWGERTRVTHAYHMGCYAAVPALRIALGCLLPADPRERARRVDVVHTELCSLHFDATAHTPEQFVVQSLFADGSIRYCVSDGDGSDGFQVLALHEVVANASEDQMQWRLGDHGMRMSLSRDVPASIAKLIEPFATALFARAGYDFAIERSRCVFAVHPGGPKIIDTVRDALALDERQVQSSRRVLRRFGNMSSATLPHIWNDVLGEAEIASGTLVGSVAFGPGLTVGGALFRKE
jgi:predicted naringenin-chalcone synthase